MPQQKRFASKAPSRHFTERQRAARARQIQTAHSQTREERQRDAHDGQKRKAHADVRDGLDFPI